jgi:hypothetical protein
MAYIGKSIESGTFSVLDTSGNTYNGSNVTFSLGTQVGSPAQLLVSHDGVIQKPGTDYTLATGGTQITFTTAPASGASIFIVEISGAVGGPLDSDLNGTELILDADADTSITADTDDQIDIRIADADDFQFTANTFTAQSGSTITTPTLGVVATKDLGNGIHIKSGDSGGDVHADADELVIEQAGAHVGMTFLNSGDNKQTINFGDAGDNNIGQIEYDHDGNAMKLVAGTTETLRLVGGEIATGGEDSPDVDAGGICIDNNALDTFGLSFKNSDVAHGITGQRETDTFATIKKIDDNGGIKIHGLTEGYFGFQFESFVTNQDTNRSTGASAAYRFNARIKSGTSVQALSANNNIITFGNDNLQKFIFDTDGDFHADSGSTTFDEYDDAQLARAYDLSHGKGVINSKFDKFVAYNHEKLADLELVGREDDGTPNHFVNVTGMQRLHNGAIWQQYEKHNQLLEAVYDLAKEAVGEEKANAILEKHEVKRLQ